MSQEFHMSDPKDAIAVTSGCGCLLLSTLCWLAIGLLVVMALKQAALISANTNSNDPLAQTLSGERR